MSRSLKRVFEFFLQTTPEVSGQMSDEIPDLKGLVERLFQGEMTQDERALFFKRIYRDQKAIELFAGEIRRTVGTKTKQRTQ